MEVMTKHRQLSLLEEEILRRNICPELAAQAHHLVMGAGNENAAIVFIGEAPGKNEDIQGVPFIGAAGKLLNEMLESSGLHREDVYITNIVKYRPPQNRDPLPEEKAAFLPYLLKQLEIIDPQVIVTLGRHSMEYFLPGKKISEVHGHSLDISFEGKSMVLVPLFHPAAALYNGGLRQTLFQDFTSLMTIVKDLEKRK